LKFIYLLKLNSTGYYKIGYTNNVNKRIKELSTGSYDTITLVNKYESKFYREIEKYLHNIYKSLKIKGEWFDLGIEEENNFLKNCLLVEKNLNYLENNKI